MNPEEPSLLSHFTEIRKNHIPEGGLSTIILCGKMRMDADSPSVMQVHRKVVEDEVNSAKAHINQAAVTGILMGQGNSFLHILEGPSDSIVRILSSLSQHDHFFEPVIQTVRVVYSVEDRPQRFFPEWYSTTLEERRSQNEDVTSENSKDIVHELATSILEVGKGLHAEAHEEIELRRYSDVLPSKNLIIALASCADFFTLEEFVEVYASPYNIELDSESSWPLERLVQY